MNDNEDFEKLLSSFRASSAAVAATVAEQDNSSIPFILEMMEEEEELAFGPNNKMMKGRRHKSPNIKRDFKGAYDKLVKDYFSGPTSKYTEDHFKRRFRVSPSLFDKIYKAIYGKGVFIPAGKRNAAKALGIHPLVRLTAVFRNLAYGTSSDVQDENLQIGETSLNKAMDNFCILMIKEFGDEYLNRNPTADERKDLMQISKARGFPGCFASWDCKHFVWDNCPITLQGQHKGHHAGGKHTKILEAIADYSCYFWYINFGDPGSLNDINVLDKSSIVGSLMTGLLDLKVPPYTINNHERDWMYFLADGIYPDWAIFVKTIPTQAQQNRAETYFATQQEAVRKDIERAFGILEKKFHILARPLRKWNDDAIRNLLYTCCIIHNMCCKERMEQLGTRFLNPQEHEAFYDANNNQQDNHHAAINNQQEQRQRIFSRLEDGGLQEDHEDVHVNMTRRFLRCNKLHEFLTDKGRHVQLKRDLIKHLKQHNQQQHHHV